jgi:2-C-methyl-D-erythritol 4-phosphate cytidylyltransferase
MNSQQTTSPRYYAIIPAAGVGARFAEALPKQFLPLLDKTVLEHAMQALLMHALVDKIVIAAAPAYIDFIQQLADFDQQKCEVITGGATRQQSVLAGLAYLQEIAQAEDWVLVHDAARPCLSFSMLDKLMRQCAKHAVGGILATPVRDTVKRVNEDYRIVDTPSREHLWLAQTPQCLRYQLLYEALQNVEETHTQVTDEAMALELVGLQPIIVPGAQANLKLTYAEDFALAEYYLQVGR